MDGQIEVPTITTEPVSGVTGGSSDYEKLKNIPKINGVELKGELTTEDLNIKASLDIITEEEIIDIVNTHIHTPKEVVTAGNSEYCKYIETVCKECEEVITEKYGIKHDFGSPELTYGECTKCGKNVPEPRPPIESDPEFD